MKRITLFFVFFYCSFFIQAQITINNGTSITVSSGTTISLDETSTQNLTLQSGAIFTNNGSIILGNNLNLNEPNRWSINGTGTITATRNITTPIITTNFAGLGLILTTNQTLGNTTIIRGHTVQLGNSNQSIRRYYDVNVSNNSSLNANIDFAYNDSTELNGLSEASLQIFRSLNSGSTWPLQTGVVNTTTDKVTASGFNTLNGRYTLGSLNSPLPVDILTYKIFCENEAAIMHWSTASEINNSFFEVQCSVDMQSWASAGIIKVNKSNSNSIKYYQYNIDNKVKQGFKHFRLVQTDLDGQTVIFGTLEANCFDKTFEFDVNVFPNPFTDQLNLQIHANNMVEIQVFDGIGKLVFIKTVKEKLERITLQELNAGIYYLVANNGIELKTTKLIKK